MTNYVAFEKPERGGCLTVFLVINGLFSLFGAVAFLNVFTTFSPQELERGKIVLFLLGGLFVANVVCIYGVFQWKQWGVYGLAVLSIISPLVELFTNTIRPFDCIAPFIQIAILYWVTHKQWLDFD